MLHQSSQLTDTIENLLKKANAGQSAAQYALGLIYLKGLEGQAKNPATALDWFLLAAEQNFIDAQIQLANHYKDHDKLKSFTFLGKAANQGDATSRIEVIKQLKSEESKSVALQTFLLPTNSLLAWMQHAVPHRFELACLYLKINDRATAISLLSNLLEHPEGRKKVIPYVYNHLNTLKQQGIHEFENTVEYEILLQASKFLHVKYLIGSLYKGRDLKNNFIAAQWFRKENDSPRSPVEKTLVEMATLYLKAFEQIHRSRQINFMTEEECYYRCAIIFYAVAVSKTQDTMVVTCLTYIALYNPYGVFERLMTEESPLVCNKIIEALSVDKIMIRERQALSKYLISEAIENNLNLMPSVLTKLVMDYSSPDLPEVKVEKNLFMCVYKGASSSLHSYWTEEWETQFLSLNQLTLSRPKQVEALEKIADFILQVQLIYLSNPIVKINVCDDKVFTYYDKKKGFAELNAALAILPFNLLDRVVNRHQILNDKINKLRIKINEAPLDVQGLRNNFLPVLPEIYGNFLGKFTIFDLLKKLIGQEGSAAKELQQSIELLLPNLYQNAKSIFCIEEASTYTNQPHDWRPPGSHVESYEPTLEDANQTARFRKNMDAKTIANSSYPLKPFAQVEFMLVLCKHKQYQQLATMLNISLEEKALSQRHFFKLRKFFYNRVSFNEMVNTLVEDKTCPLPLLVGVLAENVSNVGYIFNKHAAKKSIFENLIQNKQIEVFIYLINHHHYWFARGFSGLSEIQLLCDLFQEHSIHPKIFIEMLSSINRISAEKVGEILQQMLSHPLRLTEDEVQSLNYTLASIETAHLPLTDELIRSEKYNSFNENLYYICFKNFLTYPDKEKFYFLDEICRRTRNISAVVNKIMGRLIFEAQYDVVLDLEKQLIRTAESKLVSFTFPRAYKPIGQSEEISTLAMIAQSANPNPVLFQRILCDHRSGHKQILFELVNRSQTELLSILLKHADLWPVDLNGALDIAIKKNDSPVADVFVNHCTHWSDPTLRESIAKYEARLNHPEEKPSVILIESISLVSPLSRDQVMQYSPEEYLPSVPPVDNKKYILGAFLGASCAGGGLAILLGGLSASNPIGWTLLIAGAIMLIACVVKALIAAKANNEVRVSAISVFDANESKRTQTILPAERFIERKSF